MDLMLQDFTKGLADKGITIEFADSAKEFVLDHGYDIKYGARPLRRAISRYIEDEVAQSFIKGEIAPGSHIRVEAENDTIVVKPAQQP